MFQRPAVSASIALIFAILVVQGSGDGFDRLQRLTLGPNDHRVQHAIIPGIIPSSSPRPQQMGGSNEGGGKGTGRHIHGEGKAGVAVHLHVFLARGRTRGSLRGFFFAERTEVGTHNR